MIWATCAYVPIAPVLVAVAIVATPRTIAKLFASLLLAVADTCTVQFGAHVPAGR